MSKNILKGSPISQGVGIGGIYICSSPEISINTQKIQIDQIELEITNLEVAVCRTFIEIYDLYCGFADTLTEEEKRILDVYNAILDDIYFFDELQEIVKTELISADNAIDKVIKKYIFEIEGGDNDYVKQRVSDLNDIRVRLIRNVYSNNHNIDLDKINSSHIVVVRELNPTLAVTFGKKKVQGVVVQEGAGFLSHAAIILRGIGIPTINGIEFKDLQDFDGQLAIVDGFEGIVIIEPEDPEIERYREICKIDIIRKEESPEEMLLSLETMDKYKVGLSLNVSNFNDWKGIKNKNADGVGLVRTETLFFNNISIPSELRQTIVYSAFAKELNNKPVVFRTMDFGGDKIPMNYASINDVKSHNNRGIKWSFNHIEEFTIQIRAILKASAKGNVKISFPMIDSAKEVITCREIIEEQIEALNKEKYQNIKNIKVGVVIETKAAVNDIEAILANVDFISIGTNDLLNQIVGLNRSKLGNEIKEYFEPKFLQVLNTIISKAKERNIFVSVCGEMASDPLAAVVLIGMGVDDLSIAPSGITIIKRTIRDLYYEVSRELVGRILDCNDVNEVVHVISGFIDCRF